MRGLRYYTRQPRRVFPLFTVQDQSAAAAESVCRLISVMQFSKVANSSYDLNVHFNDALTIVHIIIHHLLQLGAFYLAFLLGIARSAV